MNTKDQQPLINRAHLVTKTLLSNAGPLSTLIIGIFISLIMFHVVRNWELSEIQNDFKYHANTHMDAYQRNYIRHQESVSSVASFFSASESITRDEFHHYVKLIIKRHSDIQALSWNPLIKGSEVNQYTQKAHEDGLSHFQITELDSNGQKNKVIKQDEHVVVFYIEPYAGNEKALGVDISSHSGRLKAIKQARDSGKAIITERIKLVQEQKSKYGYLLLHPIYKKDEQVNTLASRRKHFLGVVAGVFRFEDIMPFKIEGIPAIGIDVWITDESAPIDKQFLHFHSSRTREEIFQPTLKYRLKAKSGLHWNKTINRAGRRWSFLYTPTPNYVDKYPLGWSWSALVTGLLTTALLVIYLITKIHYIRKISEKNIELLNQIKIRKNAENALQVVSKFREQIIIESPVGLSIYDESGQCILANNSIATIVGATIDQIQTQNFNHIQSWKTYGLLGTAKAALQENIKKHFETEIITTFGKNIVIDCYFAPFYADNNQYILLTVTDITERKHIEQAHKESEAKFFLLLNSTAEAIYGIDTEGRCTFINSACLNMLGYDSEKEVIDQNMHELIHHTKRDGSHNSLEQCHIYQAFRKNQGSHVDDEILWRQDGSSFSVEYWSYPMYKNNKVCGAVVTFVDITERRYAERERDRLIHDMGERIKELQCIYTITESIQRHDNLNEIISDTLTAIPLGWHYPEHTKARIIFDEKEYFDSTFQLTKWKLTSPLIIDNVIKGTVEVYYMKEFPELDEGPFLIQERNLLNGISKSLSEAIAHKMAEAELNHLANHDPLTGLYNRRVMEKRIAEETQRCKRYGQSLSVFMIDLDHFKQVNDTYGHKAGDTVLQTTSTILQQSIRETDYAARYGGEEFVIILPGQYSSKQRS
jgi:PAS domain S-box-containing protein